MLRFWKNSEREKKLLILKTIAKSKHIYPKPGGAKKPDEKNKITELEKSIDELHKKIDSLSEILIGRRSSESPRKLRMKEKIISFLHRHANLSPSKLSELVGLSRTRCNEYLKELEREEIATGVLVGKKKIYRLRAVS
jgi:biotin operon repressor